MAIYVIGDIQGCYEPLQRLFDSIAFDSRYDRLWFVGDLVNRGPASVAVLRMVRNLGEAAVVVLGNHDLHLLAVAHHQAHYRRKDTFDDVLRAPDRDELLEWLCHCPLLHHDPQLRVTMVHAGLHPHWDLHQAQAHASELQEILRGTNRQEFFHHMYGNHPTRWSEDLSGWERLRFIANCFTRLRFCSADGGIDLNHKGPPGTQPPPYVPWFLIPNRHSAGETILFGHWSTLGYHHQAGVHALDSGCVWGGRLTALRLDTPPRIHQVPCMKNSKISMNME
ncbi:diadenosine tetraphosphatase [Gammaproteobacteria bacterium]